MRDKQIGQGTAEEQTLLGQKGQKASVEARRKQAGIHVRKLRAMFVQIIDSDRFRDQLEKEIFEQDKAIKFLQIVSKYNPAGETTDGSAKGGGNINIQINSPVDRSVPEIVVEQVKEDDLDE